MKICIDGISAAKMQGTGIHTYTYELINNLIDMYPQPSYKILWDGSDYISKWSRKGNSDYTNLNLDRKTNNYDELKKYISDNKINIYHSPNNGFSIPLSTQNDDKCKYVMTAHDLISINYKQYADKRYLNKFENIFPAAIEKSDKIIAASGFIKKELKKFFDVPDEKIDVIYPACSRQFEHIKFSSCKEFLKDNYGIEGDIILYAGSVHIRKNLDALFRIFRGLLSYDNNLKLVIIGKIEGKRYEYYSRLKNYAESLSISNNVIFTGMVDFKHMPYFYNAARCVVNLSDYEGFPLTSVEALYCNVPVICNNSSSFREVVGDEGILVDIKNEEEVKDIILEIMFEKDYRKNIIERSKRIREKYKCDTSTKKIVKLYESLFF